MEDCFKLVSEMTAYLIDQGYWAGCFADQRLICVASNLRKGWVQMFAGKLYSVILRWWFCGDTTIRSKLPKFKRILKYTRVTSSSKGFVSNICLFLFFQFYN